MKTLILAFSLLSLPAFADKDVHPVLYVISNTNNLVGEVVSVSGSVTKVTEDGFSMSSFIVWLDGQIFVRLPMPSGGKWHNGVLRTGKTPYLSLGDEIIVRGAFKLEGVRRELQNARLVSKLE